MPTIAPTPPAPFTAERRTVWVIIGSFCNIVLGHSVVAALAALFSLMLYSGLFTGPPSIFSALTSLVNPAGSNVVFILLGVLMAAISLLAVAICFAMMLILGGLALIYPAFQYRRSFAPDRYFAVPTVALAIVSAGSIGLAVLVAPGFIAGYFAALAAVAAMQALYEK